MSEIKVVERWSVNGITFGTREEAEHHLENEKLLSLIIDRCSDNIYSDGTLCGVNDVVDLVNMLHEGGFKIVEDNTQ